MQIKEIKHEMAMEWKRLCVQVIDHTEYQWLEKGTSTFALICLYFRNGEGDGEKPIFLIERRANFNDLNDTVRLHLGCLGNWGG